MALTLVTTPGSASANSYCSLAEADDFLLSNIYATGWADADAADEKTPALIMATRLLDEQITWYGETSTTTQALLWPRQTVLHKNRRVYLDSTTIPTFLKQATAELARQILLEDRTVERSYGLTSVQADTVDVVFDKRDEKPIIPSAVVAMISVYGEARSASGGTVKLERV